MRETTEALRTGQVDVWIARVDPNDSGGDALLKTLSDRERERWERFRRPQDRRVFALAHSTLRNVLSKYGPLAPEEWRFRSGAKGKPEIDDSHCRWLRFNLSHTEGLAVVAVTRERDVGVDAEWLERKPPTPDLIRKCLSTEEMEEIEHATPAERAHRFLELWALKESYLKATGHGLTVALDRVWFRWVGDQPLAAFAPGWQDDPSGWHFTRAFPTPSHVVAAAVKAAPPDVTFRFREVE